jgi:SAM-dependent methyltransferase
MEEPEQDRFARYLAAKKGVDDRSLNERVWQGLAAALADAATRGRLEIVELGAGIGTMIERVAERSLVSSAVYTAVDARSSNRDLARRRLPERFAGLGYAARGRDGPTVFDRGDERLEVRLVAGNAFEYLSHRPPQSCDLALAHAFLDEVDADTFLPLLVSRLRPGALCYFSLCFDGVTSLQPEIDARFDATIEVLYHETMDRRVVAGRSSGDSRTGRHLFERLRRLGLELLSAGSSDWVVFAGSARYEGDEAFFLHHLVDVIRGALDGEPRLDARRFAEWIARRHEQIDRGELVWISHNMDLLARVPPAADKLT